jgi:hypothetical protein|tara:strand:+ start:924 stop:1127 length:204 start_codon:yes stop_codon:yes gene_type:complete
MDIPSELVAVVSLVIGSVVWLIRLEGRVNTHEAICSERYKQLQDRHAETLDEMRSMDAKLDSIIQRM